MRKLLANELCDYLNRLLEVDRDFVGELLTHRVPCNEGIAKGEAVMCGMADSGFEASALGLLNALTEGCVCAMIEDSKVVKFAVFGIDPARS